MASLGWVGHAKGPLMHLSICTSAPHKLVHIHVLRLKEFIVNQVTRNDAHALPRIDDILDSLGDTQYFSTLDLSRIQILH